MESRQPVIKTKLGIGLSPAVKCKSLSWLFAKTELFLDIFYTFISKRDRQSYTSDTHNLSLTFYVYVFNKSHIGGMPIANSGAILNFVRLLPIFTVCLSWE